MKFLLPISASLNILEYWKRQRRCEARRSEFDVFLRDVLWLNDKQVVQEKEGKPYVSHYYNWIAGVGSSPSKPPKSA
jgi:hypothetical protein